MPTNFNPFRWSNRTIRVATSAFFMIALPIYIFIGLQPIQPVDALNYPTLEISSINLKTPVSPVELIDRQLETPATIAGSYSQFDNKILLMGHSSAVFKNLHEVEPGQEIIYNNEHYIITLTETLAKSEISMNKILADTSQKTLIIMTCAGTPLPDQDATHRFLVTATLSE